MKEKLFKKGIKRRLFSCVLALAMVFSILPMSSVKVHAAGTTPTDAITCSSATDANVTHYKITFASPFEVDFDEYTYNSGSGILENHGVTKSVGGMIVKKIDSGEETGVDSSDEGKFCVQRDGVYWVCDGTHSGGSGGGTPLSGEHVTVDTTTRYKALYRQAPIYILSHGDDSEGIYCSQYYNINIAVTGDCKITGIEATVGWGTVGVGELTVNGVNIGNTTSASAGESVVISGLDTTSVILGRTSTSLAMFSSFKVYYEATSGRPGITYSSGRIDYTSFKDLGWTGAGGGYTPWLVGRALKKR